MSPHRLIPILGAGLLAGLLAAVAIRQQRIRALESSIAAVSATSEDLSAPADSESPAVSAPLSDGEQRELLTLRRKVGEGRRLRAALESLQTRNRQLQAQLAGVTNADVASPPGAAYLASRNARFVGRATPRDTLESFFAAVRQRDTNLLFQVLDASSGQDIRTTLEGQGAEKTFANLGFLPGFRVRNVEEQPDETARVEVEFDPRSGAATESLTFQRVNGEWRLSLRF